ncbi:MAG TPA: hypothetical protein VJ987_03185 [Anaerolineales bacterium]|nr:hypothetical protein [Anaerolineales bacterium]
MKINRFIALAAIAMLVVGTMGLVVTHSFALGSHNQGTSINSAQSDACAQDQADGAEVASATDTDNVELQCGDQNEADGQETVSETDTDNDQVEEQVGDQSGPDTGVEAPEVESPAAP